jgi:aminopeptidase YwaD
MFHLYGIAMKKYHVLLALIVLGFTRLAAQDIEYAKKVVDDLCSVEMAGRGYVRNGCKQAGEYIRKEYAKQQLLSFEKDYFQSFGFQAITFPGRVELTIEDRELETGEEFIISAGCPRVNGVFNVFFVDSSTIDNPAEFKEFERISFYKTFLVVDGIKGKKLHNQPAADKILKNGYKAKGLIFANQEKLTWSVALEWEPYPILYMRKGAIKRHQLSLKILVESEVKDNSVSNVIGYVKGTKYPDSFIVITAHYDHLGMLGTDAIFPGANDNASGVAMMLDLMRTIKSKPLPYSVAFMAFAGEEAGLLGSLYYTETPLFPLNQISMLINLELMGTGDKGMTVVNATLFPEEFQNLQILNVEKDYLPTVNARGKAQNSDHYYFTEKGVKAFFFYLMGDYKYYHDVDDTARVLPFSRYNQAFSLIFDFIKEYSTTH